MRSFALIFIILLSPVVGWSRDLTRYAVILSEPAIAAARTQGVTPAVESARARVLTAQEAMKSALRARGIRITGASHTLLNAVFIAAEPEQADQLKSIAGVSHVARLARFHL